MHMGRSQHTALHVIGSIVGGFLLSFGFFAGSTYVQLSGMQGQLVAGDPNLNRQLPTTLNAFQGAINGSNPMMSALTSYGWWMTVLLGTIVAAFAIFKVARRYV